MTQMMAGTDSAFTLQDRFADLFGHDPVERGDYHAQAIDTPLGAMIAITDDRALHLLEFHDRKALEAGLRRFSTLVGGRIGMGRTALTDRVRDAVQAYLAGKAAGIDLPVALRGTAFQTRVWQQLQAIPAGQTRSYAALAAAIGQPTAIRAVASANGANRLALVVPCHRVIGTDGTMTGYAGGLWRKERLIALERKRVDLPVRA